MLEQCATGSLVDIGQLTLDGRPVEFCQKVVHGVDGAAPDLRKTGIFGKAYAVSNRRFGSRSSS